MTDTYNYKTLRLTGFKLNITTSQHSSIICCSRHWSILYIGKISQDCHTKQRDNENAIKVYQGHQIYTCTCSLLFSHGHRFFSKK